MKKLLCVIDMQNDFICTKNGILGFPKAEKIVDKVYNKIKEYESNGDYVLFTHDTHFERDYLNTREGKNLPVLHCIDKTEGHRLYGKLKEFEDKFIHIDKYEFGVREQDVIEIFMEDEELYNLWAEDTMQSVELIGVCTDICVISNAIVFQRLFTESDIIIDASCCASFDDNKHESALNVAESLQMKVINRGEI